MLLETARDRAQILLRAIAGYGVPQAPDDVPVLRRAVLRPGLARQPELRPERKVVAARHHADDGVRLVSHVDGLAREGRAAAQAALPVAVAHHRHALARPLVVGTEHPPRNRRHAQDGEEAGRDLGQCHAKPLTGSDGGSSPVRVRRQVRKAAVLVAQILEIGIGDIAGAAVLEHGRELHQGVWLGVRERP